MQTLAHHTCKKDGGRSYVLHEAPFLAEQIIPDQLSAEKRKPKIQFLGEGYYFWDNNIEMAIVWGKNHCKNCFFVVEMDIEFTEETCLDLVGNRGHQLFLVDVLKQMKEDGYNRDKWEISKSIEYLKKMREVDPDIFPYNMIRAIDLFPSSGYNFQKVYFNNLHYTYLNPKIMICVIDKTKLKLESKRIIHAS